MSQYVTAYAYNDADRLVQITYPSGMVIDHTLDASGRITAVDKTVDLVTESLASSIQYEPFGPVYSFTYGNGLTYTATFDQDYELDQLQAGSSLNWVFGHDPVGNTLAIDDQLDNSLDQAFTYDDLYRLDTATQNIYGSEDFDYDSNGNRTRYQNGVVDDAYTYEPQSNRLATQNGWSFSRDAAGNRIAKLDAGGYGQLFAYADNNRLVQTSVRDAGGDMVVGDYVHDGRGQRVSKTTAGVTTHFIYGLNGELLGEYVVGIDEDFREYVYLNGQPLALYRKQSGLVVPPPVELIIDNGDTGTSQNGQWLLKTDVQMYGPDYLEAKKKASNTYTWTTVPPGTEYSVYAWWIASNGYADNVEYTIGYGFGQTATVYENQQINGGQWNLMGQYGAGSGPYFVEVNAADGKTSADAIKLVYQPEPYFDSVETTAFIHADHLGTPRAVSDATQTIVWRWDSTPFGDSMPDEDPDGDSTDFVLNLRFPGQYFDQESGLHYNYFRDYDASTGRYIESDQIGLEGGLNTYAYAEGHPIIHTDEYGLAIYICYRDLTARGVPGNHSYFWDSVNKRCCGRVPNTDPLKDCKEKGPSGGDYCIKIENSDGRETDVINCCKKRAVAGKYFPLTNDCYNTVKDCISSTGLIMPTPPVDPGRTGPCSSCNITDDDIPINP